MAAGRTVQHADPAAGGATHRQIPGGGGGGHVRPWVKPPVGATGSQAARHGDGAFRLAAEFDAEVGAALHQLAVLAVTNVHRLHARTPAQ